ncbi:MAG TPA: DMT family transporter [Steroidobacteraceae bacterium]|jgi:drug/metabolite transporter (DMT)-like permease
MNSRRILALASLVVLMIVWGGTFVVTKAAAREIPPLTLAALRFIVASMVLVPIAVMRGGFKRLPRPVPLATLVLMALSGTALFTVGFNYALVYASASQGALIYALGPAAMALAAVLFLGESPSKRRIMGIALSVCGVALVVAAGEKDSSSPRPLLGALWMLGVVVSWAGYTVFAKRLANADQVIVTACVVVIGAVVLMPAAAIELMQSRSMPPPPSLQAWLGVLFLGVVASALAYIVYGYVLRELDASLVGAYTNLDPIIGVLTAVLFLGETLHGGQVAGGFIALAGMWLAADESE